jgi:hypothetical protein
MKTNNVTLIRSLLSFDDINDFYIIKIIKRRKDNSDMKVGTKILKSYYINSIEDYDKLTPSMVDFCDSENARAYIILNKRNYEHLSLKILSCSINHISNKNFKSLPNVFDTVAGKFHSDPVKKWMIDVDNDNIEGVSSYLYNDDNKIITKDNENKLLKLCDFLMDLQARTKNVPMLQFIPTKNGMHIITRPFNFQLFSQEYPNISIHKDAKTVLYCP